MWNLLQNQTYLYEQHAHKAPFCFIFRFSKSFVTPETDPENDIVKVTKIIFYYYDYFLKNPLGEFAFLYNGHKAYLSIQTGNGNQ